MVDNVQAVIDRQNHDADYDYKYEPEEDDSYLDSRIFARGHNRVKRGLLDDIGKMFRSLFRPPRRSRVLKPAVGRRGPRTNFRTPRKIGLLPDEGKRKFKDPSAIFSLIGHGLLQWTAKEA